MSETLRSSLQSALSAFATTPLREASLGFFKTLGYASQRTVIVPKSSPRAFLDLFAKPSAPGTGAATPFDQAKALFADWLAADLLFQLTDQELSREDSLFPETGVSSGQLRSYIFFAIELKDREYPRGKLAGLARQLNRLFPTPVMVLIKHGDLVTLAVINRRRNKLDAAKDVLEKATLIRDIVPTAPHRGHLDILASLALPALVHPQKKPITDFDTLHAAWEQIFNVELLNERFYRELSNWYFWALPQVQFPADLEPDDEKRRATGLIRLLTRLIFCWFLKEKNLIPEKLFHPTDLAQLLKGFDPESETSSTYYQAILQNLFFATLNQRMGKDGNGKPYRVFATDEGFQKNRTTYDVNNLYRYEALFRDEPDAALAHFADIPFLNGGLFECLDRTEDGTDKKRYLDGFSRNSKKRPHVPDRLFFDSGETADLSTAYGDTKRKAEKVTGLITILNRYKFTIVENTPIDQEIALDPELLGKVFENLLASYNEETKTTARKQTGSFYTPRPIVDYMVDESLKAHLTRALVDAARMKEPDAQAGLDLLFAYTEKEHAFTPAEVATLIAAIDALKILDPACGSGAFPMGVLHKLVYILQKLDPDNDRWKQTQLAKLDSAPMREELERAFADNNDDYGRKLYLIENCLYGVDIQPIAIQITKLRFFISLVCDQKTNRNKKDNHGIRPLPNLETKFVAANTLIGLPEMDQMELVDPRVYKIEADIETLYHSHFSIQRRDQKLAVQSKVKVLRRELATLLAESLMAPKKAQHVADWDPFNPQSCADFFDPHWMFGRSLKNGFDIVIGNPPWVSLIGKHGIEDNEKLKDVYLSLYDGNTYMPNLYEFFLRRGLDLITAIGYLVYIISDRFGFNESFASLRKRVLDRHAILQIVYKWHFESVIADTMTILIRHSKEPLVPIRIKNRPEEEFIETKASSLLSTSECAFKGFKNLETKLLVDKVNDRSTPLGSLAKSTSGFGGKSSLISQDRRTVSQIPILKGASIGRYAILGNCFFEFKPENLSGRTRDTQKLGLREKVLLRKTGDRLIATYDDKGTFPEQSLYFLYDLKPGLSRKFVLGLLNSRLITWFYLNFLVTNLDSTPQLKNSDLNIIPITVPNSQTAIVTLVDKIPIAKKVNPVADTSTMEREIDQQVYALYGLTPEEIAIVEGTAP